MALFLMSIIMVVFLLSTFIIVFLLNYKEGKFVKKQSVFIMISLIVLVGLCMNISSLPSNYIKQKIGSLVLILVTVGNIFLYKKKFNLSRIVLSFTAFMSLIIFV